MNLSSGDLFWPTRAAQLPRDAYPSLNSDIDCDVLVIGGGVTGAMIAHALAHAGIDLVLVDKREIAGGSTAANTALLLYELDTPLHELIDRIGRERAERVYLLCRSAVHQMRDLLAARARVAARDGIAMHDRVSSSADLLDCGFEMKKSLYVASSERDVPGLMREVHARRHAGIAVDELSESEIRRLFSFSYPCAILSHDAAQLDPVCLTRLLARDAAARGARVYERTELRQYEETRAGAQVRTKAGHSIRAHRVIHATGYEMLRGMRPPPASTQITYAIATQPLESFDGWWERCLVWETARPYSYLRTTSDGRAIIGGEDEVGSALPLPQTLDSRSSALRQRFERMFPRIRCDVAAAWAGVFKTTRDSLPYIGPHPGFPHSLLALGYGGNGMTFSVIAANILRDLCRGRPNSDADLFRVDR